MKTLYNYITLLLICIGLTACSSDTGKDEFQFSSPNVGALNLQLPVVNEEIPVIITKAANFEVLDANNFIVEIYKAGETSPYKRATFIQLKQEGMPLELAVGNYTIKAFSYDKAAVLRDKPYFEGSASLTIESHEVTSATVECKYKSIGVEIVLSERFNSFFHDTYQVTVSHDKGASAVFSKDTPERIYFTEDCSYVKVTVDCTTKDNEVYPTRSYYFNKNGTDPSFNGDGPFVGEYFIITIDTDRASGKAILNKGELL